MQRRVRCSRSVAGVVTDKRAPQPSMPSMRKSVWRRADKPWVVLVMLHIDLSVSRFKSVRKSLMLSLEREKEGKEYNKLMGREK